MSAFELWCIKFFFDAFLPPSSAGDDYYEILGVNRRAKPDEIRRAYRRLARNCHPDKKQQRDGYASSADAQEFKRLHEAYEVSES
jgi:DnaJ-class molecular chaperone